MQSPNGIVLSWCVAETDRTCAAVDSYHLYAYHQDNSSSNATQQHWKKIGEVKALPLPMACTLTQFQSGSTYHFAVRAKDIHGRFGSFCEPQCTNVISSSSSWTVPKLNHFMSKTAWVPLFFLCWELILWIEHFKSICKYLSAYRLDSFMTWRSKRQTVGFVWLMSVMYFLWLKLLYKTKLLYPFYHVRYLCCQTPIIWPGCLLLYSREHGRNISVNSVCTDMYVC